MGRPQKNATSGSSPRPATTASKTTPATPLPSASATQARTAAVGSRSRSTAAARTTGPSRGQGAKPDSSQQRPTASHGAQGGSGDQHRASTRSYSTTQKAAPDARAAAGPARPNTEAAAGPARPNTKAAAGPARPNTKAAAGPARPNTKAAAGPARPNTEAAAGPARPNACPQKQQPGDDQSRACGWFLPQLESQDIPRVEKETRGQRSNPKWYEWRANRITASMAPRIANSNFANGKTDKVPQSYLKAVVDSSPSVQTRAMAWGIDNEKVAIQAYEQLKSQAVGKPVRVEDCGLFIDRDKKWIAASPDGIIKEAATGKALGLLEVKCPYKHRNNTVRDACNDKDFCLKMDGDSYALKKDHGYFTQVQCQLAATGFQQADFVVHTNKETAVVPVKFDSEFWGQTVPKLEKFYTEAVIPHLQEKAGTALAKEE
ncbi:EZH inhibitory protein [Lathamus discolor]|uniref:EZH inhibitory protein n=1 Tax=Lathamus discolor TaxID=678569 RepID=UPI0032B7E495